MNHLVSILIPAYNSEKWIKQTLKSALNQTWPNKEIIIVDDGSTDRTLAIAKGFECNFVKVVRQENKGAPAARNTAISLAQGDFIQWLDHDDLLAPDKIECQMKRARDSDHSHVLLSGLFGTFYYRFEKAKFVPNPLFSDLSPVDYFLTKFLGNAWLQPSVWLVSKKLTEAAGPWLDVRSPDDDGEYYCRIVAASQAIEFVPEAKSYWRIGNSQSMSRARSDEAIEALFLSTKRSIQLFRNLEDSDRSRRACIKFLQDRLLWLLPERPDLVRAAQELAEELGGEVALPRMKLRYRLVSRLFGIQTTISLMRILQRSKEMVLSKGDRMLYRLSRQPNSWSPAARSSEAERLPNQGQT